MELKLALKDILPASFGLLGVFVGGYLTIAKEKWFYKKKNAKDAEYLSIRIVSMLDQFVDGCANVVCDDGLCYGQLNEHGCKELQVKEPHFKPDLIDVEWKSLPSNLMYEILSLPSYIDECNGKIENSFDFDGPPDYDDGLEERQYQYSKLGLKAMRLSNQIRKFAGIPDKIYEEWNPTEIFNNKQADIYKLRKQLAEAQSKMFNEISSNNSK